jgi:hypothetical protein
VRGRRQRRLARCRDHDAADRGGCSDGAGSRLERHDVGVSLVGLRRPLPTAERARIATRADTRAAIGRWDDELAVCIRPIGEGDDSDATCTHDAWNELVLQVEVAMYYLLDDLRAMPRGACHDALAAQNDLLRAFWHGAAPLNQAWLDEQQRPPSLFDLRAAVDLVRPVPGRIRDAATTVCAA